MSATTSKRQKTPAADWSIFFEDVSSLRLIVEAVSAVMQRAMFRVEKRPSGLYFLCVDGADVGYSCCVSVIGCQQPGTHEAAIRGGGLRRALSRARRALRLHRRLWHRAACWNGRHCRR